jgi:hypothetical protein
MTLDRPNLADAFNKPRVDRAAALTGLLPAPRPARPAAPAEPTDLAPERDTTPDERAPAPAAATSRPVAVTSRPRAATEKQRVSEQANIVTNVAVYLEPDLLELAKERRRSTGVSYDQLVGDAFAAIADDRLAAAFRPDPGVTSTSGMPTRQRRVRGTAGIQIQLRLDTNQRAWIDQKQHDVAAPSRSALVAAVLRLHLTS